jgi:RNA polymerase sigma-70 factor (ECF subfamily)
LFVHCYRILGSVEDAEDALQETWIRAWRHLGSYASRAPFRAWLYKIATNASLDARTSQRARTISTLSFPQGDPTLPFSLPATEIAWIEPAPSSMLFATADTPALLYDERESVSLAFLAVLQLLPGRQRAALILRDVLGWSIPEVAEALDMTVAAVNSALQRARATMHDHNLASLEARRAPTATDRVHALLDRYVSAWQAADVTGLVSLLREDAVFSMPPLPQWFRGRADIALFAAGTLFPGDAASRFSLVAVSANGHPAFGVYQRDESGIFRPSSLQLLTIVDEEIAAIDSFLAFDERLFARFQLPGVLG